MNIEIKVNTAKFEQALSDLPDAIARAQRVALNQIGNTVKNRAIDAFRQPHYRPSPWAPRKNNVDPERPLLVAKGSQNRPYDNRTLPESHFRDRAHQAHWRHRVKRFEGEAVAQFRSDLLY